MSSAAALALVRAATSTERLVGEGVSFGLKVESASEARLGSMGGADRLLFTGGGSVQVSFYTVEVVRILEAVAEMEQRKKSPDAALVAALDTAQRRLNHARRVPSRLRITVPLAVHAVELTPVLAVVGDREALKAQA